MPYSDDCWRCCIARALKIDPRKVLHFLRHAEKASQHLEHDASDTFFEKWTRDWLKELGYGLVRCNPDKYPRAPHIRTGTVSRSKNLHAAVYEGKREIYNPGKRKIKEEYLVFRFVRNREYRSKKCRENRAKLKDN
jgi:hypothetical protein